VQACIRRHFRSYTLTTLFLGWWGISSIVLTPSSFYQLPPVLCLLAIFRILHWPRSMVHTFLPSNHVIWDVRNQADLRHRRLEWLSSCGRYSQVELTEKYFPASTPQCTTTGRKMNPMWIMFSSESAPTCQPWSREQQLNLGRYRSDLLHNESSLVDLETQNAKLQDTLAREVLERRRKRRL